MNWSYLKKHCHSHFLEFSNYPNFPLSGLASVPTCPHNWHSTVLWKLYVIEQKFLANVIATIIIFPCYNLSKHILQYLKFHQDLALTLTKLWLVHFKVSLCFIRRAKQQLKTSETTLESFSRKRNTYRKRGTNLRDHSLTQN